MVQNNIGFPSSQDIGRNHLEVQSMSLKKNLNQDSSRILQIVDDNNLTKPVFNENNQDTPKGANYNILRKSPSEI
jgi:hypothetical protein